MLQEDHFLYDAIMAKKTSSEEDIKQIVEVLRYLIAKDEGLRIELAETQRKAKAAVLALAQKYKVPPIQPP